ncbi:MAG: MATE family efflux transporter [Deltaproteobacteria bacterium]|nr:MATE family efflux transporter [Deltaproteobacteria bacterium]
MTGPSSAAPRTGFVGALSDITRLAPSLALVSLGHVTMGLVDTAVVGQIGRVPLAAVGLGSSLTFLVSTVGLGVGLGTEPLAAQAFGAGDLAAARDAMRRGVALALIVALPVLLILAGLAIGLGSLGVDPAIIPDARAYMSSRLAGVPPLFAFVAVRAYLQATKRPYAPLVATFVANVANLVGDWLLVYGDDGLSWLGLPRVGIPRLEALGAGIATVLATCVQLAVVVVAVRIDDAPRVGATYVRWRKVLAAGPLWRMAKVGLPIGLQIAVEAGVFTTVAVLMARFGAVEAAAHQVTINLASASFNVLIGIGSATSIVVGHHVGAGSRTMPLRAGAAGLTLGAGVMLVASALFLLVPEWLARLFTNDPVVVATTVDLLRIAGAFQLVDGTQAVASGALRGAADTAWPFAIHAVSHWGVGFTAALVLAFVLGLGGQGLWWGLTAGLAFAAVLLVARFVVRARRGFTAAAR